MPADLQPYLLRVLEEGMVWRLGEAAPRKIACGSSLPPTGRSPRT